MDKVALSMVPTGQPKSTQKSQTSWGKGGHLGCSDSFNFNLYKPVLIAGYTEPIAKDGKKCIISLMPVAKALG